MSRIKDLGGAGPRTGTDLTASLAVIPDQSTLAPIQLAGTAVGGVGTLTHGYTVNGVTTGLDNAAIEDPIFTPTAAGTCTAVYTVSDEAGQSAKAARTFLVGDQGQWIHVDPSAWTKVSGSAAVVTALSAESVTLDAVNADAEAEWDSFYGSALPDGEYLVCIEVLGVDTSTAVIMVGVCNRAAPTDAAGRFAGIGESAAGAVGLYTNLGGSVGTTALAVEKALVHITVTNGGTKVIGNEVVVYGGLGNIVGSYAITAGNTPSTVTEAGLAIIFARNGAPPAGPVTLAFRMSYCKLSLPSELG